MASAQRLQRLLRAQWTPGVIVVGSSATASVLPVVHQTRLFHVNCGRYRRLFAPRIAEPSSALSGGASWYLSYQGVRCKSEQSSDKKGSARKSAASASDEVNRSLREQVDKASGSTGQQKSERGRRPTEKDASSTPSGADAPHGGSQIGLKPDPARMAKMVHPAWQEASTDAGGYLKLEDIGFDERDVAAKNARALAADERLKQWDPKDTGRRSELPYNLLKGRGDKEDVKGAKKQEVEESKGAGKRAAGGSREKQGDSGDEEGEGEKESRGERSAAAASTQQTVLWESSRRSTSGAQSTSDAGGMGQLTEQLLDRDEADERAERQRRRETEGREGREKWKDKEQQSQQEDARGETAPKERAD